MEWIFSNYVRILILTKYSVGSDNQKNVRPGCTLLYNRFGYGIVNFI